MEIYFLSLILFLISMIGSPGPANMLMIASGIKFGFKSSLPFVFGVIFSKQFIIWPIALGVVNLSNTSDILYVFMKYMAATYILYLALKMYNNRIASSEVNELPPTFLQGLMVHPLNPKAWLMIATASASFVPKSMTPLEAAMVLAPTFLVVQLILHPTWCFFGSWVASRISGTVFERIFIITIMALTFLSILLVVLSD